MPLVVQAPLGSQYVRDELDPPRLGCGTPGHWARLKIAGPPSYPPIPFAVIQ
jgi:hypothetical protein